MNRAVEEGDQSINHLTYGHKSAILEKVHMSMHMVVFVFISHSIAMCIIHFNDWSLFKSVQRLRKKEQKLQKQLLHLNIDLQEAWLVF